MGDTRSLHLPHSPRHGMGTYLLQSGCRSTCSSCGSGKRAQQPPPGRLAKIQKKPSPGWSHAGPPCDGTERGTWTCNSLGRCNYANNVPVPDEWYRRAGMFFSKQLSLVSIYA